MNNDDILDALNEVDDTCIRNAQEPIKKKRKALWISAGAAAACFAAVLLLPRISHIIKHGISCQCRRAEKTPSATINKENSLGIAYAGDFRERQSSKLLANESYQPWPWEYNFICYQYPAVEYNGITYRSRTFYTGDAVSERWISKKLTDAVADVGYNPEFENAPSASRTIACELFELKGIATQRFLAVKYDGHEEYYVFMQDGLNPPATLGDLITNLSLPETFPLTTVTFTENRSVRYSLSEADSSALWDIFLTHASCDTVTTDFPEEQLSLGKNIMTFTIDAEALGLYNRGWTLTSGGYLRTNIEDYGYYYHLGTDAVNKLVDFVSSHKKEAPPKQDFSLIGVVTEITDTYIKVDDTLCMKNPADGLEFTVELNDLRLERYVACNRLQVGNHVWIRHTGTSSGNSTLIATAYELSTGRIDENGVIYVPE